MTIYFERDKAVMEQYIGRWDQGFLHGFTRAHYNGGEVGEALFENGFRRWDESQIESYNPKNDQIAQRIDVDKHLFKDDFGPPPIKKKKEEVPEERKRKDPPDSGDLEIFKKLSEIQSHKFFFYKHLFAEFPEDMG